MKNRQEINEFFKNSMFKFTFRGGGILAFETIEPIDVDGSLRHFEVTVFDADDKDFFCYSKIDHWLKYFQVFEVRMLDNTDTGVCLYFAQFINPDEDSIQAYNPN